LFVFLPCYENGVPQRTPNTILGATPLSPTFMPHSLYAKSPLSASLRIDRSPRLSPRSADPTSPPQVHPPAGCAALPPAHPSRLLPDATSARPHTSPALARRRRAAPIPSGAAPAATELTEDATAHAASMSGEGRGGGEASGGRRRAVVRRKPSGGRGKEEEQEEEQEMKRPKGRIEWSAWGA